MVGEFPRVGKGLFDYSPSALLCNVAWYRKYTDRMSNSLTLVKSLQKDGRP